MKRPFNRALRGVLVAFLLILIALQGQSQSILDLLSSSPSVAYSLRQLKSSATRAIQVRRSSDGLTMDIGFTAGGDLDQVALLSFVGSDNGYISIWYDQSGNGHDAIQATAAKQPRIVNAGVVDVQNGRPICNFDGSTSTMATAAFTLAAPLSVSLVSRRTGAGTSSTGYVTMFDGVTNNSFKIAYPNTSNPASMGLSPQDWSGAASLQPVPQLNSNTLFMYSALCDASSGVQYLNGGVQYHNFPGAGANLNGIRLFRGSPLPADNELPAGQLSEVVVFGSKLSNSDRQLLDCSQSSYYSIQVVPAGMDIAITSGSSTSACSQVKEDVAWQASVLNNVYATGSQLTKYQSNSWDGGAASWNTVSNNGYLQFTASETDKSRMVGLSTTHASNSYTTIQYAWFLTSGSALQIYESGSSRGSFGTYATGDILKIAVEAGTVKYYKNGVLVYISNVAPTLPMIVDVSLNDKGGTVTGATVTNYGSGTFTATAVNAGASPGYQWLLNGSPVGANSNTYTNAALNAGDVVSCVVTPNIPGCGALTATSNNITAAAALSANTEFYIQGTPAATSCGSVVEQVKWDQSTLSTGMSAVSTNSLSKFQVNGWNGGAASWNTVSNNGYFQFTASETNKSRMAGLSTSHTSSSYTTIQYAFYLVNNGNLGIYESGSSRGTFGTYTPGDVLKITVENNVVKYYKNSSLLYVSLAAPTLPMLVDVSINDAGGTISNALVSNYTAGVFTASVLNAGANPTYQWLLNGSPVGTNSATYSNTSLNNSDVVTCVMTPDMPGCNTVPVTSNTITEVIAPPVNVDLSIQGVAATTNCNTVIEQVKWKLSNTTSNMTIDPAGNLSKFQNITGGWDCVAYSWNTVSDNGYFQFTATETNKYREVGLSASYTGVDFTNIQFGFYLNSSGALQIYESGTGRGTFGSYATGDVLKIAVEGGVVKYYQNGNLLYISNIAPTLPLAVQASMYNVGATIANAVVSNYNAGTFIANNVGAGAAPTFQWKVNGVVVQTSTSATYSNTGLASGDVVTCVMTPDLAGCNSVPLTANTIRDTVIAPINVDFSIQGTAAATSCNAVLEQVKWNLSKTTNNMTVVSTNSLSKFQSNWTWDGGVASWNTVSDNGYFQFTATETNTARMAGLSTSYTGSSYTNIQYAFYLTSSGALQIYESGSGRGTFGTYATGDVLKIAVEGGVVRYYQNGTLLYISGIAPTLPMLVDVSMYNTGATISNAQVFNYNAGSFTANTANAGAAPTFRWKVNGTVVQTGTSATYTNTSLVNGDVVTCEMTPDLPGCIAVPMVSNTIRDTVVAPLNMDFSIQGVASTANCNAVIEQVKWKLSDLNSNLTIASVNNLSRFQNNGWNAGASSWNTVSNNGYLQFTASETNTYRAIGLSNSHTGNSYTNIQYCFYLNSGGGLQIIESGSGRGTYGTYATGDVLKIAVENNVVKYYKNGTLLYISGIAPTLPMLVDASIYNVNGTLTNAMVSNYNAGTFIANTANAGANPTFQWMVNGVAVQTGTSATYTNTGLAGGDVVTCMMTPNLAGCNAIPVASNTIRDTVVMPVNLDFSIQGTPATTNCASVVEQVEWKLSDLSTSLIVTGVNGVSKFQNGGWNSGVSSWNTVSNNGYFQFTATETNKSRMAGLSTSYTGASYTNIQYAFYLVNGGSLQIYESGSYRGSFGTYVTGDVLKITVEAGVVKYYKNGSLLYMSNVAPTLPMLVDVSINDVGGTIGAAVVSNYSAGTFTANTVNAGANPNFRWMVNGVTVQNGAGAIYTNTALNNGDVVTCELTPDLTGCSAATTRMSNAIMDSVAAPLNLDFSITGTAAAANCKSVTEQVKWKLSDLNNNLVTSGNSISRFQNNGWNAGASSWNTVSNNGYFQFTATETNKDRMAGLSSSFTGDSYTNIQYAFFLTSGGSLAVYESGSSRGTVGTYTTGDVLKISVESNVVRYYKNGTQVYVSAVAPVLPLLVNVSINASGGSIGNALVSNYNAGVFTANTANAGTNPTFRWMVNGVTVQTGAGATYTNTSLNNGDVVTCALTPDLPGCNMATTYASNTIANSTVPPLNVEFAILGTAAGTSCAAVVEQVKWKLSNLSPDMNIVSVNSLSKSQNNGVWDGGAASWNTVSNNGYFQFTAGETTTARMAGLSTSYTSSSYTTIQYAFYLVNGGTLQIYESGANRGSFGTYTTGDVLKIAVENNVVKYYKNGTLLYVSSAVPTLPMLVDVSVRDAGGTISNATVSNYSTGTFTATTMNAGTNPTFQWMVNGVTVQTGASPTYTNTGLSNNDVITCVLTPDLPGCSVTTYNSNTITNTTTPPLNLEFTIQGVVDPSSCAAEVEQVKWKLSNLSPNVNIVSVNSLSKFQNNGAWDGGAASWNTVSNNGYFQFTASETTTSRMAGLSTSYTSSGYTTIQYAFYLVSGGSLQIYESGANRGSFGTYATGDVLKIAVENNVVRYYKNGTLLRASGVAPTLPMLVDVSINNVGGTITNAFVSNLNSGSFTANAVNAGSSPNYQWQVNGVTVQTGLSATYTNGALASGDVVTCILTPNLPGCVTGTYPSNTATYVKSGGSTTWTGAVSNSWFTSANWSAGLPDRFTSAVIAAGMPNDPTMSTDASVYNITINSGATLTMSGSPVLSVYRSWTNNGTFTPGTGTVSFVSCSSPAVINSTGTETFYNLVINTPYGVTIASGTQQVSRQMTFVTGLVTQNATLTFLNGSTVSGASDASHVIGVVTKVGTGAFTFPVGDNTSYRPIAMSSPSSATDVFTAQYIHSNPGPSYPQSSRDITLNNVSGYEYWMLNRVNGSSNVTVTLSWNINSGVITSMGGLHVAGWSTAQSKWKDLGSSATTGNTGAGTVTSGGAVTTFGAFTLASLTVNNVLPIHLLYFQCNKINASLVDIDWSTGSEQNSSYFVVERSSDGQHFEPIQTVPAAGSSSMPLSYTTKDSHPLKGLSYYRLKLVDLDGTSVYSDVRTVNIGVVSELNMYPNPTTDRVFIGLNDNKVLKVSVFDNLGREMLAVLHPVDAVLSLDVSRLAAGMYLVVIDLDAKTRVTKKLLINR